MKRRGGFLKSLGIFILCLTAPAVLICAPLIISNLRKSKTVKPQFRIENECVQYTQDKGKTWDTIVTVSQLLAEYGGTGNGIKSITINANKTDDTKTTYIITFDNNDTYEYVVKNGEDGKDGSVVTIGENGYWYIDGVKTNVKAIGQDGEDGQDGQDGEDGKDGTVITIGENGNWLIDGEDSGVPVRGQDGQNGQNGTNGTDGEDGISYYVYIRYASEEPTSTTELKTTADAWMGIYSGTSATAPADYTQYTWYNIKGQNGADGSVVTIGEDGYWYIDGVKTNVKAIGQDGQDGQDGTNGQDGQDGSVVTIVDGYWYIDGINTNVKAVGQDGQNGTNGTNGQDGISYYVFIRYASEEPTSTTELKTTADAWMGIYSGTSATAPADYTQYTWYNIKGEAGEIGSIVTIGDDGYWYIDGVKTDVKAIGQDGQDGEDGSVVTIVDGYWYIDGINTNVKAVGHDGQNGTNGEDGISYYVFIRYASEEPTSTTELKTTADAWMGIYSGTSETAPADYTQYTWYNIKGSSADVDHYTVTYNYGVAGDFFKVDAQTNALKTSETVKSTQWIDTLPEIKDAYIEGFKGWFIENTDIQITQYDFIGRDTTLEPRFHFNEYAPAGLYENGTMTKNWAQLVDTTNGLITVDGTTITDCNESIAGELIIDNSIITIREEAFFYCTGLTKIIIPDSVTSIGYYNTFSFCSGLTDIIIGNSVTSIGEEAFSYCSGLTEITIPNSVTSIGNSAFSYCSRLTNVIIGNGVTTIGRITFDNCYDLEKIIVNSGNTVYDSRDNCNAIIETATNTLLVGCKNTIIPSSVTEIEYMAFSGITDLTEITIPSGVTSIGDYAFQGTGLTGIAIPGSLTTIARGAFQGCENLINVKIGSGVTTIGNYVFYDCTGLTEIVIPNSVTSIGDGAFSGCSNLKTVVIDSAIIANSLTGVAGNNPGVLLSKATTVYIKTGLDVSNSTYLLENFYKLNVSDKYGYDKYVKSETELNIITLDYLLNAKSFQSNPSKIQIEQGTELINLPTLKPDCAQGFLGWFVAGTDEQVEEMDIIDSDLKIEARFEAGLYKNGKLQKTWDQLIAEGSIEEDYGELITVNHDLEGDLIIADSITYLYYDGAWGYLRGCDKISGVFIPSSMNSINSNAFYGCSALEKIVVSSKNTKYDSRENCNGIIETLTNTLVFGFKNTIILDSVTTIGNSAFYYCTGLTSIDLKNVTTIGNYAFYYCTELTEITIPDSVTTIGNYAFSDCTGLESVTIGSNVQTIGEYAFYGCAGLTSIDLKNVTTIGEHAFYGCAGLTSIDLKNVTTIGDRAFYGCTGLTEITIPDSVTSIGSSAFYGCIELESVAIGSGVQAIGNYAFSGCTGLTSVTVNSGNSMYISEGNCIIGKLDNTLIVGCKNSKIPDSVTSIGSYAFFGCTGLTEITIPDSVKSIGQGAFYGCAGLTSIDLKNVKTIGNSAFSGCARLTSIDLKNVTIIGNYAFYYCTELTEITIPNSVTSIGEDAFLGCAGLTSITVDSGNSVFRSEENCIIRQSNNTLIVGCKNSKIPDSVTTIGEEAFYGCIGLESVTMGSGVKTIGSSAFRGCTGLTSVDLKNVTTIGEEAFRGCTELTEITIPDSVMSIGSDAFYGCIELESVTIGSGVKTIGSYAFRGCTGLTEITIPDSVTSIGQWAFDGCTSLENVTIGSGVKTIGQDAFRGCTGLTEITIPDSVTSIGQWAFDGCTSLENVTIGSGVKTIGSYAFRGCTGLTSVDLKNVTTIGEEAFGGCTGLTEITIPDSVTSIDSDAFDGCTGLTSITVDSGNSVYRSEENCIIRKSDNTLILGCKTSVIPNSVTSIGSYAFYGRTGLTEITILDSVTSIGSYAFYGCGNLYDVKIESEAIANSLTRWNSNGYLIQNALTVYIKVGLDVSNSTYLKENFTRLFVDDGYVIYVRNNLLK